MTLEAYLMEKLNLTEEEAVKICEAFRSYKKEYGRGGKHGFGKHGRDSRGGGSFKKGFRGEKDREALKENSASEGSQDLSQLHCDGCEDKCPLDNPGCGKGRRMAESYAR